MHAVNVRERRKNLLAAHSINHPLLPLAEHGVRENGKIAEHPQEINPL